MSAEAAGKVKMEVERKRAEEKAKRNRERKERREAVSWAGGREGGVGGVVWGVCGPGAQDFILDVI